MKRWKGISAVPICYPVSWREVVYQWYLTVNYWHVCRIVSHESLVNSSRACEGTGYSYVCVHVTMVTTNLEPFYQCFKVYFLFLGVLFYQLVSVSNLDEISFIWTLMKFLPDLPFGVTNTENSLRFLPRMRYNSHGGSTFVRFIDCSQCVFVRLCCIANGVL